MLNHLFSFDENDVYPRVCCTYTVSQKKGTTLTIAITLSILDHFAKFFHCCKEQ